MKIIKKYLMNIVNVLRLFIRSTGRLIYIILMLNLLSGLLVPINAFIYKNFIDNTILAFSNNHYIQTSVLWLMISGLFYFISVFIANLTNNISFKVSSRFNFYFSELIMDKVNKIDFVYFEDIKLYNTIEKVNNETLHRSMNILNNLILIVKSLSSLAASIAILWLLNANIIILCVISAIPVFYVNLKISLKEYKAYNDRLPKTRLMMYLKSFFIQYNTVKEMKINRVASYFKKKILSIFQENINIDIKIKNRFLGLLTLAELGQTILMYGMKLYILITILRKKLTIGDLTFYISCLDNFNSSVKAILESVSSLFSNNLYIDDMFYLLNFQTDHNGSDEKESVEFKDSFKKIEVKNLSFQYPNTNKFILKNINLVLESDKTYAIVGLNGSGKTTLLKLLMKLYNPSEGDIFIDGINMKNIKVDSIHKHIGAIFQDYVKYPLTVKENIGVGNIDEIENIEKIKIAARHSGADKFIQDLEKQYNTDLLKQWVDDGTDLSIGQWQKLALSRALISDASIMLLDEPTASIDAQSEYELFKGFRDLMFGKMCIFISHRFSSVKMADHIFVIQDGKLLEEGCHNELMKQNGVYKEMFLMQANSYL